MKNKIEEAVRIIAGADHLVAFTGAGISTESGIPPFRGPEGLWNKYDPKYLELSYFYSNPSECWPVIRKLFYDFFASAEPNDAHLVLSRLEQRGLLKAVITQNIDNLHQRAGSERVIEFHGNSRSLICTSCGKTIPASPELLDTLPPRCSCGGLLKPDFIFFGEGIPAVAWNESQHEVEHSDALLVIGSTGEVFPAASLPIQAASHGASIVEINPRPSNFTDSITDVFIPMAAGTALTGIEKKLDL